MCSLKPPAHQPLSTSVADSIREAIELGSLLPGERLTERRLATELGVSHIPVREALAQLEDEGLVVREPRRGARVSELSDRDLEEIGSVRTVLEQLVVERVIMNWSDSVGAELDAIVTQMLNAARAGDAEAVLALDQRFHEALWHLADHRLLVELAGDIRLRVNRFLRAATMSLSPSELVAHVERHRDLVDVLASRDVRAAKNEVTRHVAEATDRIKDRQRLSGAPRRAQAPRATAASRRNTASRRLASGVGDDHGVAQDA